MRDFLLSLQRLYWKLFNPKTYGVKVIIQHPELDSILLVQHSYGDTAIWHLPGGGYNPKRESAAGAASREVFEELGIELAELTHLAEYKTSAEGKRDTVAIYSAVPQTLELTLSNEIKTVGWLSPVEINSKQTYQITHFALESFLT